MGAASPIPFDLKNVHSKVIMGSEAHPYIKGYLAEMVTLVEKSVIPKKWRPDFSADPNWTNNVDPEHFSQYCQWEIDEYTSKHPFWSKTYPKITKIVKGRKKEVFSKEPIYHISPEFDELHSVRQAFANELPHPNYSKFPVTPVDKPINNRHTFLTRYTHGDIMPSARHEIFYLGEGTAQKAIGVSGSWPAFFTQNGILHKARELSVHYFSQEMGTPELPNVEKINYFKLYKLTLEVLEAFAKSRDEKLIFIPFKALKPNFELHLQILEKLGFSINIFHQQPCILKKLSMFALPLLALGALFKRQDV